MISGIIFDYGGTIDTNGMHWFEVFCRMYNSVGIMINKEVLRKAYIFGEQEMERNAHLIKLEDTFKDNLQQKIDYQIDYLIQNRLITQIKNHKKKLLVDYCYNFAYQNVQKQIGTLSELSAKYPLAIVSNFYGNLYSVLKDFKIDRYFQVVIESAKIGIRKPDPEIFRVAVKALNMESNRIVVIGDSYTNDVAPAQEIGCTTIWLRNLAWNEKSDDTQKADYVIQNLEDVLSVIKE